MRSASALFGDNIQVAYDWWVSIFVKWQNHRKVTNLKNVVMVTGLMIDLNHSSASEAVLLVVVFDWIRVNDLSDTDFVTTLGNGETCSDESSSFYSINPRKLIKEMPSAAHYREFDNKYQEWRLSKLWLYNVYPLENAIRFLTGFYQPWVNTIYLFTLGNNETTQSIIMLSTSSYPYQSFCKLCTQKG